MPVIKVSRIFRSGLEDSWTRDNEVITLKEVLEFSKGVPVEEMPISALKDHALSLEDTVDHANLDYPILVLLNDDHSIKFILDGHHRIQKALKLKLLNVKVKKILFSTLPDRFKQVLCGS